MGWVGFRSLSVSALLILVLGSNGPALAQSLEPLQIVTAIGGSRLQGRGRSRRREPRTRPDEPALHARRPWHAVRVSERCAGRVLDEEHLHPARHDLPVPGGGRSPTSSRTLSRCRNASFHPVRPAPPCSRSMEAWRLQLESRSAIAFGRRFSDPDRSKASSGLHCPATLLHSAANTAGGCALTVVALRGSRFCLAFFRRIRPPESTPRSQRREILMQDKRRRHMRRSISAPTIVVS